MVSLFSRFVAQGAEVPVVDPRLTAHLKYLEVVKSNDGPAAQAEGSQDVEAPATPTSTTSGESTPQ